MLTSLRATGFRAFAEPASFDCDADAVILVGPNGTGKTTFFDAIEWALFGKISRLPPTRDAVGDDYIANRFDPRRPPDVSLCMTHEGRSLEMRRVGGRLSVRDDEGHETKGPAAARMVGRLMGSTEGGASETAYLRSQCLGQDRIAKFVRDATPRDRFDSLSTLLGTEMVRRFYRWIDESIGRANDQARTVQANTRNVDQRLRFAEGQVAAIAARASSESQVTGERINKEMVELEEAERAAGLNWPAHVVSTDLGRILSVLNDLLAQILARRQQCAAAKDEGRDLVSGQATMETARATLPALAVQLKALRADREALEQRRRALSEEVEGVKAELAKVNSGLKTRQQEREAFARFLVSSRVFVHGDRCPVCEQTIDATHVLGRISARTKSLSPDEVALIASRDRLDAKLRVSSGALDAVGARIADARSKDAEFAQRIAASKQVVESWGIREAQLVAAWPGSAGIEGAIQAAGALEQALGSVQLKLVRLQSQAKTLVDQGELASARASELRLRTEREPLTAREHRLGSAVSALERLARDAKAAEIAIVEEAIATQMPVLRALYQRLNPHPLFDSLDVKYGNFDRKGEVYYRATSGRTSGNVSMMFSSAQLNAVGVCIFLSLSLMRPKGGPSWVLLDDPIQNMDDYNILGLVDLLRSLRGERQVIVSTHDEQIGELLRRKMRPRSSEERTAVHRFISIDEDGPRIVSTVDRYAAEPFVLEAAGAR